MTKNSIRFGITDGAGNRASTWKIWSPSNKSDVYLACRSLGGYLKASFHESGSWHIAYTQETFEDLVEGVIRSQTSRFLEKWPRPSTIAPGTTLAYRIITPHSAVNTKFDQKSFKRNVTWIACDFPHDATEVAVLIISPNTKCTGWPGKNSMNTELIGSYRMANDETVWVVFRGIDMPDLSKITQGSVNFYRGKSREDLMSSGLRALVFDDAPDGSRVLYDVSVEYQDG